jgi:ubiquinone/menaquinone biosynthesis C-methylase UbiE
LLSVHVGRTRISLVVDLGCGTGRFSELLAAHFGVQVVGIDPSQKMLERAGHKTTIENLVYCQGLAEALPFRDGCADLVFMSMVFTIFVTHPPSQRNAIARCARAAMPVSATAPVSRISRIGISSHCGR